MVAQGTQDHRISIIQGGSSSRTHPVQPVSLSGMTRTLGGFGQCDGGLTGVSYHRNMAMGLRIGENMAKLSTI